MTVTHIVLVRHCSAVANARFNRHLNALPAIVPMANKSFKRNPFRTPPLRLTKMQMMCIIYILAQGGVPLNSGIIR